MCVIIFRETVFKALNGTFPLGKQIMFFAITLNSKHRIHCILNLYIRNQQFCHMF